MLAIGFQRVGLFFFSCTQFQNRECGHLSAQKLDQPDDITDQRSRHRATGRDCGLWAAVFAADASLSRFGEGQVNYSVHGISSPLGVCFALGGTLVNIFMVTFIVPIWCRLSNLERH